MELPYPRLGYHATGTARPEHLQQRSTYDPTITLFELERRTILASLEYFNGNKTHAANALGITIKTLYNKLHCFGVFEKYKHKAKR